MINDPHRDYGTVPSDLLTITDREWKFVPDVGGTETFLFLDECPACDATVPITRATTLADLGAYLDTDDPAMTPRKDAPTNSPTTPSTAPAATSRARMADAIDRAD